MSDEIVEVKDVDFKKAVLESTKTVIVDFFAEWCGPCKMVTPIIEEIANQNQDPNLKFVKVDVDQAREIAAELGIRSIPAIKIFKNGQEVASIVGAQKKEKFIAFIEAKK